MDPKISTISNLPPLPPYLQPKREPERRVIIVPDILWIERNGSFSLKDHENNWETIIHSWMNRIVGESFLDPDSKWEMAHSQSRQYRQWLETYPLKDGIPPHIGFGGAIKSVKGGDPTFYEKWKEWTRGYFY